MREEIKSIIAQSLGLELSDVEEAKLLKKDLAFSNNELDEILHIIEERYNFHFSSQDMESMKSVGNLLDIVESYNIQMTQEES